MLISILLILIKQVTRLNLMIETENISDFKEREDKAYSTREKKLFSESLTSKRIKDILDNL